MKIPPKPSVPPSSNNSGPSEILICSPKSTNASSSTTAGVWYARNHFAEAKTPWDARGDIYIRYGDPDYRARSGRANPEITPAVEQVKERLALALYGPEAMDEVFTGPVYPIRSNQSFVGELDPAALARTDEGGNILVPPGTIEGNQNEFILTEALGADGEASG